MLTAQEVFDKVWSHFIVEKHPRSLEIESSRAMCRYRDRNGNPCAVGLFISDEEYAANWDIENWGVNELEENCMGFGEETKQLLVEHKELLQSLQNAHDFIDVSVSNIPNRGINLAKEEQIRIFKGLLRSIAAEHCLVVPGEDPLG